tara:strand:+ start:59 stop:391 length:333 start_codon:yes stop_codon:yes gene_type:complete
MSSTSSSKRITAVLPKASKTAISVFISQCAKNGSLDAPTVLALSALMDDREFAVAFKNDLSDTMAKQKETRIQNKAIREEKKAAKESSSSDSDSSPKKEKKHKKSSNKRD